jgi:hypothetical protein
MYNLNSMSGNRLLSTVETPHLAIIHLLRAKGCCSDSKQVERPSNDTGSLVKLELMKSTVEKRLS